MRPSAVEVLEAILAQHALQVTRAEHDDVVEALATNAAQETFALGVHAGSPHGGAEDSDARSLRGSVEVHAELVVVVTDEEPGSLAERLCAPEQPESFTVPPENGLGLHDEHGVTPARHEAGEQHQEPPLVGREFRLLRRPRHHDQLLAQGRVLREEFFRRTGDVSEQPADERDGPRRRPQGRVDALGDPADNATNPPKQRKPSIIDV